MKRIRTIPVATVLAALAVTCASLKAQQADALSPVV
jgi:hypothetical protein